ncbi:MAG: 3-hydroxyacyl-CoA dehydrogenase NAD-binding domain-containing protein [bacterium]
MEDKGFTVSFDAATGVATLTMAMPGKVNKINADFGNGFIAAFAEIQAMPGLKGIIIASGHKDFCAGADIDFIYGQRDADALYAMVSELHAGFRALETCGKPVVALLTGSALGGGYEIALACHRRIAVDHPAIQFGLPEVSLGVIPGGGGTQRLPRIVGLQASLEILAQGKMVRAPKAKAAGLVDELCPDAESAHAAAVAWIAANPRAKQPWDDKRFVWPGGVQPDTGDARNLFAAGAAMLVKKTAGAYAAPEAAVKAVYEGALLDFDSAMQVEARYFVGTVVSDQAKDMIRTFWYHRNAVNAQANLPKIADARVQKVGILGAGMMGAGLAFVCAQRGYDVVLKDIRQDALDKGLAHIKGQIPKLAKHLSKDDQAALLARVTGTLDVGDLAGCDLVIEAVFENLDLKHRVIRETEAVLGEDAIFASNTSALPIADLVKASIRPANFIGLHFFSPVEQMPLLEVITPGTTSEETLARALAFGRQIKKTSIVVNDGYGFFTTRFFSAYIMEAAQLVAEGHSPLLVERAARAAGMVVSPLKVFDEVTLSLAAHGFEMRKRYFDDDLDQAPGVRLIRKLVELGRTGKAANAGFYDYTSQPRSLWAGLADVVAELGASTPTETGIEVLQDRLMLAQVLEAARCLDEGILKSKADAEIGAIMGVGFAPNTGGPLAWMDRRGVRAVVTALDALAAAHGPRYAPPASLRAMAEKGERFFEAV